MSAADDVVVVPPVEDEVLEGVDAGAAAGPDYLNMSDEELMNAAPPEATPLVKETPVAAKEDDEDKEAEAAKQALADKEAAEKADPKAGSQPGLPAADLDVDGKPKPTDKVVDPKEGKVEKTEAELAAEKEAADKSKDAPAIDYEAAYNKLLAPFKANGKEIKVDNVEDAVALMQMGANYNKKMAALKPNLKLMKMLENNQLMSEEKIGFLIDLAKKDPAAINKLVKDAGIDPMDLDGEKASTYKQTSYAVDDREIDLDTVLDELKDSTTYTRTLDVVSNKWDVASKQVVSNNPQLLKIVNDHMASGIYDLISTEVEKEQRFGRLKGMSDIEAYKVVGDAMDKSGKFAHLASKPVVKTPVPPVVVVPKPKVVEDDKLKDKKRAASSTPPVASTTTPKDFNPLSMSDEEFLKVGNPKFL